MKKVWWALLSMLIACGVWEGLLLTNTIDINFFPPPRLIIYNAFHLLNEQTFLIDIAKSMSRLGRGSLISIPIGLFLGLAVSLFEPLDLLLNPLVDLTYPIPKAVLFPLFMLVFGIKSKAKVALIAFGMFFLVYLSVRAATKKILNSPMMDVVKIYQIKGFDFYYHFLFKGILKDFLIGVKAAVGYGLLLLVVSEFTVSKNGLGHFIWESWDQFRILDMYSGVFVLCFLGLFLATLIEYITEKYSR